MQRIPVPNSSNILSHGYDPDTKTLELEFRGHRVYRYFNVPHELYQKFLLSPSAGKFFCAEIDQKFEFEGPLEQEDEKNYNLDGAIGGGA